MINTLHLAILAEISTFQIIDLTHEINETTCVWDGSCGFTERLTSDYQDNGFKGQQYTMRSCLGTHLDSPSHVIKGAADCSTMQLENCIVPAYVIDVSQKAYEDYGVLLEDIQDFENRHEEIKSGSLVFFFTGWSTRWDDSIAFRNVKEDGIAHFPFITQEVAEFLVARDVAGIGIDTLSPDPFYSSTFPVHKLLLGAGKYIIESVAHLENMPATGAYAIALPLKIKDGAESPIRLVGLVSK